MLKTTIKLKEEPKIELEDQFILRLPQEEAEVVRKVLKDKPKKIKKTLQIRIEEDMKNGIILVNKRPLTCKLVQLPSIIDSCKTINRVNIYKTATISQMLMCIEEKENVVVKTADPKEGEEKIAENLYPHGISPPMKNVRKQRFRKTMRNQVDVKEAADVQKEVMLLLRTDYEAVSSRYELISCAIPPPLPKTENITEHMLFGAISSSDSEDGASSYDIMDFNN